MGLSGASAALIVQNGWTDDLFPAPEALRVYRTFRAAPGARLSLQLGDLGHQRGSNDPAMTAAMTAQANAFFDFYLKGQGRATAARQRAGVHADLPRLRRRWRASEPRTGSGSTRSRSRCAIAALCA